MRWPLYATLLGGVFLLMGCPKEPDPVVDPPVVDLTVPLGPDEARAGILTEDHDGAFIGGAAGESQPGDYLLYNDRARFMGDRDFVDVPVARLASRAYAQERAQGIDLRRATPSSELPSVYDVAEEGTDTTHFSIVDAAGNRVAATLSINGPFGAGFGREHHTHHHRSDTPALPERHLRRRRGGRG